MAQNPFYRRGKALPLGAFLLSGLRPPCGQAVVTPVGAVVARLPEAFDQRLTLETMQRRVKRALLQLQDTRAATAHLLDDLVTIHRPAFQQRQQQHVEAALQQLAIDWRYRISF